MRKILLTAALSLVFSSSGWTTATVRAGYMSLPVTRLFPITNLANNAVTNGKESLPAGMLYVSAKNMTTVDKILSIGFEIGAGTPNAPVKFDMTKDWKNPSSTLFDRSEGDSITARMSMALLLAKADLATRIGDNNFTLGVGVGMMLAGFHLTTTDQWWDNSGVVGIKPYKNQKKAAANDKFYTSNIYTVPLFIWSFAPAVDMPISETDSVGVEAPLAFTSVAKVNYTEFDQVNAGVNDKPEKAGYEIGGFSWGINIGYTRKF